MPTENGPISELEQEHRLIQRVIAGLAFLNERLNAGERVDPALLTRIVDFLRVFADQLHHGKEEAVLFPTLELRGVPPQGCPVGALTGEHKRGRAAVSEFEQAIRDYQEGSNADKLAAAITVLTDLYPAHIWKEDYLLFPLCEKVLTAADRTELAQKFAAVDIGPGKERFEVLADELSAMVVQG